MDGDTYYFNGDGGNRYVYIPGYSYIDGEGYKKLFKIFI